MKFITIFLAVDAIPTICPAVTFHSNINTATTNTSHFTHRSAADLLNNRANQFNAILSREINKPLGNLRLATEMLEVAVWNDTDSIMGVISRNATRISNLLSEFKHYQYIRKV